MLFDFLSMADDREERKIANTEINGATIDTCAVTDSNNPYETAISHPNYRNGHWIVVQEYNSKEEAKLGHSEWVEKFTDKLPEEVVDVSTCEIAQFVNSLIKF